MTEIEVEKRIENAKIEITLASQEDDEEEFYFWQMHLLKLLDKKNHKRKFNEII